MCTALGQPGLHFVLVHWLSIEDLAKHDVLVGVEQRLFDVVVGTVLALRICVSVQVLGNGEVQNLVSKRLPSLYRLGRARC